MPEVENCQLLLGGKGFVLDITDSIVTNVQGVQAVREDVDSAGRRDKVEFVVGKIETT